MLDEASREELHSSYQRRNPVKLRRQIYDLLDAPWNGADNVRRITSANPAAGQSNDYFGNSYY